MHADADPQVRRLYQEHRYPAMSHPLSDPAVTSVAASIGGLQTAPPSQARILEIGCASGHNLLPLARRWPDSRFTGIDLAEWAVADATALAAEARINNVSFLATDLRTFAPGGEPFDFIIAHGFFSWVPDEVKSALLEFCRTHLAPSGIATISFNLTAGWVHRMPVIAMVRSLLENSGGELIATLEWLRGASDPATPYGTHLRWILDDMLAKGPDILPFDDFGPVNDPWPFEQFVRTTAEAGLRWLGESDPAENLPTSLGTVAREALAPLADYPLHAQLAADFLIERTFRSGVLCRDDAPIQPGLTTGRIFDLAARAGNRRPGDCDPLANQLYQALDGFAPECVPMRDVLATIPDADPATLARLVFDGITNGSVWPRIEPVRFDRSPPERPLLNPLLSACARRHLPLVDVWHHPCGFPAAHYEVLAAMDGSRTQAQLADFAKSHCPELDFNPWLRHLGERGLFTP